MIIDAAGLRAVGTAVGRRGHRWRRWGLALGLVVAATAAAHGHRVQANLHRHHWEDWRFFRHARTQLRTPIDCFTKPGVWPGLYRPLSTNGYYLAGRWTAGNKVEAYHVVNAVLFVANGILLFAIAARLLPAPWSFVPPVLHVSRLAHVQVVQQTSEIQALLSTFFALAAVSLFLSGEEHAGPRRDVLSALALLLALLSKESVVVVPALLAVQALLSHQPRWRRHLLPWAVTAAWLVAYQVARLRVGGGEPTGFTYDVSWSIVDRFAAYGLSFLNVLVWPVDGSDMAAGVLALTARPWVTGVLALATLGSFVALLVVHPVGAAATAATRTTVLGLAWFLLGMTPFVFFADRLFMRYAYFGHAGLAVAAGGAACLAAEEWKARASEHPPRSARQDNA